MEAEECCCWVKVGKFWSHRSMEWEVAVGKMISGLKTKYNIPSPKRTRRGAEGLVRRMKN